MFHSEFVSVFSFYRVWCTCRFVLPPGWSAGSSSHPGTVLAGSHLPAPADPQASDTPLRRLSSCRHLEKQKWNYQWKTTTITNHWWENAVTHLDVGILLEIFWTQVNKSVIVLVLVLMFTGGNITASYLQTGHLNIWLKVENRHWCGSWTRNTGLLYRKSQRVVTFVSLVKKTFHSLVAALTCTSQLLATASLYSTVFSCFDWGLCKATVRLMLTA